MLSRRTNTNSTEYLVEYYTGSQTSTSNTNGSAYIRGPVIKVPAYHAIIFSASGIEGGTAVRGAFLAGYGTSSAASLPTITYTA